MPKLSLSIEKPTHSGRVSAMEAATQCEGRATNSGGMAVQNYLDSLSGNLPDIASDTAGRHAGTSASMESDFDIPYSTEDILSQLLMEPEFESDAEQQSPISTFDLHGFEFAAHDLLNLPHDQNCQDTLPVIDVSYTEPMDANATGDKQDYESYPKNLGKESVIGQVVSRNINKDDLFDSDSSCYEEIDSSLITSADTKIAKASIIKENKSAAGLSYHFRHKHDPEYNRKRRVRNKINKEKQKNENLSEYKRKSKAANDVNNAAYRARKLNENPEEFREYLRKANEIHRKKKLKENPEEYRASKRRHLKDFINRKKQDEINKKTSGN